MNRMRTLLDSEVPAVAVSFQGTLDTDARSIADEASAAGVDIAELRVDRFPRIDHEYVVEYAKQFENLATLGTIRSLQEGGSWSKSENDRLDLFRAIIPFVDAVDVEISADGIAPEVISEARAAGKLSIVSYHNFDETPSIEALEDLLRRSMALESDYVKISAMANSLWDVRTLAELLIRHPSEPLIVIAMGALGTMSRVFFPALGSRMTYSFIGGSLAPGQLDFRETLYMLRKFYPAFNNKKIIDLEILEDA